MYQISILYLSPPITAYLLSLTVILGLVMGSFCNAWAWRLARGESIVRGRSHCAACGHPLGVRDLIPLVSYLLLRGRCRYCGAPVSRRYPAVEAVSAAFFVSVLLRWDLSLTTLRYLLLGCLLLTLSLVDWETREIPDRLIVGGVLAFLLRLSEGWPGVRDGLLGGVGIGASLLLLILLADRVAGRETMGGGDLKLIFVLGLHFGPALTLMLLIFACAIGLFLALAARRRTDGGAGLIPFGPALALAAWAVTLAGAPLLRWYLGLFF